RTSIYHLCSLLFIITFVISLSILVATVSSADSSSKNSPLLTQTALFIFVVSINLYLIARQRCYYMERRKLFGKTDEHINAVYETRFSNWDKSMFSNWIQIMILIIEFFQLMTFPLRDLINVTRTSQSQAHSSQLASLILNTGSLMPDMRTPTWYRYSLWTTFTTMMCSLFLGLLIHAINFRFPYKISTRWVRWCIPVATLLYIPVLTTFVSSAACQSLNVSSNDYSSTLRCNSATISRPLYFWLSLFGYIVAYVLLTVFLTSYERVPNKNEIAFKSISVAFIKNMGLLLAIVFLLVESTTNINRMRAILSIIILLTMICYNIKTQPCYVDKINFFRTISFACILWTSTLVAVLSDTNAAQSLGPVAVIYIIIGGWVFIVLCFFAIYFVYYIQPPDRSAIESSSTLHSHNGLSQAAYTTCSGDNHNQKKIDTQFQDSRFTRIFSKWFLLTNASKQDNDTQCSDCTDMHIRY
ncbi:hypothetical protein A0J61_11287, partial [Choanephora cucurbitarum]